MPTNNLRARRPQVALVAAAAAAFLSVCVAPSASGAHRLDPDPGTTTPATTAPPTTTVEVPTTGTAPPTTTPTTVAAAPTTTVKPAKPGASTTTTTSTTLPGAIPADEDQPGFIPTPLIPSADTDPLFHAALQVDTDYLSITAATKAVDPAKVGYRSATQTADAARRVFVAAHDVDVLAAGKADRSRHDLKLAAVRAYTGYQGGDALPGTSMANGASGDPAPTYMALTTEELRARIASAAGDHRRALQALDRADDIRRSAAAAQDDAHRKLDSATSTLAAAKHQLKVDQDALLAAVAADPDLAPGTLTKLPSNFKHAAGITTVDSPAGTIVIPKKADKRTAIAVQFVVAQYGKPYLWGGTGPDRFDCSGLMMRAFQAAGVSSIPRVSEAQQAWATPIEAKDAQPGDLVFFGRPAYHVGMYIGGGLMIDAPYTGSVVRVDRVWPDTFSGFGRVIWP